MKTIYLIRHGLPEFPNGEALCMGKQYDFPLSAEGRRQAEAMAEKLAALPVEAVYTSPALRCLQTAQPLAERLALEPVVMESLCELYGGLWEGMTRREIHEKYPRHFLPGSHMTPPGGESDQEGWQRGRGALKQMLQQIRDACACVTHSSLIKVIVCAANQMPFGEKRSIQVEHGEIVPLVWDGSSFACPTKAAVGKATHPSA